MLTKIQKRDGRTVPFNIEKIADAIYKAARAVGGNDYQEAGEMAEKVCDYLEANVNKTGELPTVEEVQDAVEKVLKAATQRPPRLISFTEPTEQG